MDTSILIEYFRKKKKENSVLYKIAQDYGAFAVSVITEYEIMTGSTDAQKAFWHSFFQQTTVLPFTQEANHIAVQIFKSLKAKNMLIEIPDILIAASAMSQNLPFATINTKHFERIDGLRLIKC